MPHTFLFLLIFTVFCVKTYAQTNSELTSESQVLLAQTKSDFERALQSLVRASHIDIATKQRLKSRYIHTQKADAQICDTLIIDARLMNLQRNDCKVAQLSSAIDSIMGFVCIQQDLDECQ